MSNKFNLYDHQGFTQSRALAKDKRNKQTKRLFRVLFLIVSGVVVLTLIARLPPLVSGVIRPFPNIHNDLVNYNKIDFKYRTNILLITYSANELREISLGSLDPTDKKVQILSLDPEQKISGKEKDYTLNELFALKVKDSKYLERLTAKIIETLGFPVDGYIMLDQRESWQQKDQLEGVANEIFSFGFFFKFFHTKAYLDSHLKTNLSVAQLNTLITKVKNLRPDRFSITKLKGGEDVLGYLQPSSLNKNSGVLLTDSQVSNDELAVEVVNASSVSGAGTMFKNILNNFGVNVVDLTTSAVQEESELIHKKKTNLDQRLDNLFKEDIKVSSDSNIDVDERIIIGNDLAKYFDF